MHSIKRYVQQGTRPFITNCNGVHHLYAFSGLRINLVVLSVKETAVNTNTSNS